MVVLIPVLLLLLVACRPTERFSPTPFPTLAASVTPPGSGPIILTVTELSGAPGLFKDTLVQITGQFRKQPLLVCETQLFPSPASWNLVEEGLAIPAGGFDQQVRSLLPEGLTVTAEGRWRQWQGVVGCGKQARPQEIWYLDVSRIISPSPLAQVTLTPTLEGLGTDIAEVPPESSTEEAAVILTRDAAATLEFAPEILPEATEPLGAYPVEPTLEATPTVALLEESTPVAFETTITTTLTITPTIVSTVTSGTPGPPVAQGSLLDLLEEFAAVTLNANEVHSWSVAMTEDDSVTIYTIAPSPADVVMSIIKDGQPIVNRQNLAPAGEPEVLTLSDQSGEGTYQILVEVQGGQATDYAILPIFENDFPIRSIVGILTSGNPRTNVSIPANGTHYWFFEGETGQTLTIQLTPDAQTDPLLDIFGPDAQYLNTVDEGFEGDGETYELVLSEPGLYALRISELNYEVMIYSVSITLN